MKTGFAVFWKRKYNRVGRLWKKALEGGEVVIGRSDKTKIYGLAIAWIIHIMCHEHTV
jgi:hypothetical protein